MAEAVEQVLFLGRLAGEQRHLLGVLPQAHEAEAEIRLVALLIEIELDQRAADQMGDPGAEGRIDQRRPNQIAGNLVGRIADHQRRGRRQGPQDHHEGDQRDDRAEQRDADAERAVDELLDVLGDALIGVVGLVALEAHAVMGAAGQPAPEIGLRQPAPPADLQPLLEIELVDRGDDEQHGEHGEHQELVEEGVPVLLLQRRVEGVVPGVEADVQPHLEQLQGDDHGQQPAPPPTVFAAEIGKGDTGKLFGRSPKLRHA